MVGRVIHSDSCVAEGAAFLANIEPRFKDALERIGPLPLRLRKDGFAALLDAIVSQQISVASADAVWSRLKAAGYTGPEKIAGASEDALRECGLSRQKIRYAKALAGSGIRYHTLRSLPYDEVSQILTAVPGIGTWSADIYAMFSLGRADVFAPGDLALQEAGRILFDLESRPNEKQLRQMAQAWSPWRSVAARILWAFYRIEKQRKGLR